MSTLPIKLSGQLLVMALVPSPLYGLSVTRHVIVESTPAGATVLIDGHSVGSTPFSTNKFTWKTDATAVFRVVKENYESQERIVTHAEAKQIKSGDSVRVSFQLVEVRREVSAQITADLEAAAVFIDNKPVGNVPLKQTLNFQRASSNDAWNAVTIRVEKPPRYQADQKVIQADQAADAVRAGGGLNLRFSLAEIRREIPVEIRANVEDATVSLDAQKIGVAPMKYSLVFSRKNGTAPWPALSLKIEKEGQEFRRGGTNLPDPAFTQMLTMLNTTNGLINADQFVPITFVSVPVRMFDVQADRVKVITTNILSEVRPHEQERPPSPMITLMADRPLVLSRISAVPDQPENFVYSMPLYEERPVGTPTAEASIVGANIFMRQKSGTTPLTQGRYFDLDPFVTADGQWVYFSSDRSGTRIIWRVPLSGKGGYTPITGIFTKFDTEPAVSPDSAKLAFTSRLPDASVGSPSYIWIADADGKLPTQRWPGRFPAWSPDGKRISFVSPDSKICIADLDSSTSTELTLGDAQVGWPLWAPSGKHIIYAANQNVNDRRERQFDIWIMAIEGMTQRQLTVNGSFDASPALSSDGKFVFFYSNRGGQRHGQETLQIYRTELGSE